MVILFMLRSLLGMLGLFIATFVISILVVLSSFTPWVRSLSDILIQKWGQIACWLFGVKVDLQGIENRPGTGCVFLFNHTSFFDIFVMAANLKGLRFGAKIELFRIPFFGAAMRRSGILPIERNRREAVFKVYEEARSRFAMGDQIALAPEGTRQNEERLGRFKSGPFVFAIQSEVPVVPVVIKGALDIMPKGAWWPSPHRFRNPVQMILLPAVSTTEFELSERPVLQEKVFNQMNSYF